MGKCFALFVFSLIGVITNPIILWTYARLTGSGPFGLDVEETVSLMGYGFVYSLIYLLVVSRMGFASFFMAILSAIAG